MKPSTRKRSIFVKKLKVTPEDNDTSRALTKAATEERAHLAKLKGGAFWQGLCRQ